MPERLQPLTLTLPPLLSLFFIASLSATRTLASKTCRRTVPGATRPSRSAATYRPRASCTRASSLLPDVRHSGAGLPLRAAGGATAQPAHTHKCFIIRERWPRRRSRDPRDPAPARTGSACGVRDRGCSARGHPNRRLRLHAQLPAFPPGAGGVRRGMHQNGDRSDLAVRRD